MTWPTNPSSRTQSVHYGARKLGENMEDKSKDILILFSILTGRNSHVITIVIVGHLLIEYLVDKIIFAKLKNARKVLEKSFSEKVKFLYPDWLPLFIYKNIRLLNDTRNDIAHNLGTIDHEPLIYMHRGGKKTIKIPRKKNREKFYFRELIHTILFDLVNYSFYSLKISDELDLNVIFRQKK